MIDSEKGATAMNHFFYNMKPESISLGPGCRMLRLPLVRQSTDYTCGVACVQSILRYAGYDFDIREDKLAAALKSDSREGTGYHNIVEYLNSVRYCAAPEGSDNFSDGVQVFQAEARENISLDQLASCIDAGRPVICALQAWGNAGDSGDYSDIWDEGHYVIALGYDDENFFFMDPSTLGAYTYIPKKELTARWHDEDSRTRLIHFGIVVALTSDYDQIKCFKIK